MSYIDPDTQRAYQREWRARRRQEWLIANGPCVRCGSWEDLEIDHVDRSQKVSHSVWSWSRARREAELAKCQVLCHPCHVEKTKGEVDQRATHPVTTRHGVQRMYVYQKCRCDECVAWKKTDNAQTLARRREKREAVATEATA